MIKKGKRQHDFTRLFFRIRFFLTAAFKLSISVHGNFDQSVADANDIKNKAFLRQKYTVYDLSDTAHEDTLLLGIPQQRDNLKLIL